MNIGAVSQPYSFNYNRTQKNMINSKTAYSPATASSITLNYFSNNGGDHALTCVGTPDGGSASVFKSDAYSELNPEYKVKYWDKDGSEKEYLINPREVNPEEASYMEMLAYTTYADVQGYTKDGFGHFITAAGGVNQDQSYSLGNIDTKQNFKTIVAEMMKLQYDNNNLEGYLSYKQLFDYMGHEK